MTTLVYVIWLSQLLAELGVVAALSITGRWRIWGSVMALASFRAAVDIALLFMAHPKTDFGAACYFWTYWGAVAISGALEIWIVVQIACAATAHNAKLCGMFRLLIPTLAALYLTASAILISDQGLSFPSWASHIAFKFDQASSLAWLFTFMTLSFVSAFFGLIWPDLERRIAIGYSVLAISHTAISWLLGIVSNVSLLSNLQGSCALIAFGWWIWTFTRPPQPKLPPPPVEAIRAFLDASMAVVKRLRAR